VPTRQQDQSSATAVELSPITARRADREHVSSPPITLSMASNPGANHVVSSNRSEFKDNTGVITDLTKRIEILTKRYLNAEAEKSALLNELASAQIALTRTNNVVSELRQTVSSLTQQLDDLETENAAKATEILRAQSAANRVQEELQASKQIEDSLQTSLDAKDRELITISIQYKTSQADLAALRQANMEASNDKLETMRLQQELESLQVINAELQARCSDAQAQQLHSQNAFAEQFAVLRSQLTAAASFEQLKSQSDDHALKLKVQLNNVQELLDSRDEEIKELQARIEHLQTNTPGLEDIRYQQWTLRSGSDKDFNDQSFSNSSDDDEDISERRVMESSTARDSKEKLEITTNLNRMKMFSRPKDSKRTEPTAHDKLVSDRQLVGVDPSLNAMLVELLHFNSKEELLALLQRCQVKFTSISFSVSWS
jgi:chromosome segregation ATPase